MKYDFDKGCHSVYTLQYHLIMVVKYRKKVFTNEEINDFLKMKNKQISNTFETLILNQECNTDHIHIIFKAKPTLDIPKYINTMKTITSKERYNETTRKSKKNSGTKNSSHRHTCLITTGQVTLDQLKRYVEHQRKK